MIVLANRSFSGPFLLPLWSPPRGAGLFAVMVPGWRLLTFRALRRGFRIVEIPIRFEDRRVGHSKMSRRIFLEATRMVWKLRWDALRGRIPSGAR